MIFLDTHAIVWLAADQSRIPRSVWAFLDSQDLVYSPMAALELQFLSEIGRIGEDARSILDILLRDHGLTVESTGWARAAEIAQTLSWTRDPFDRLIAAHALVWGEPLLSKDASIRANYRHAFWDAVPVRE